MPFEQKPDSYSESGDPIYKYNAPKSDHLEETAGDVSNIEAIDKHLSEFFKSDEISVFHEIVSDKIHVDIYFITANELRDYHILITSGMSSLPMNTPEGFDECKYAEIMTLLPKDWPLEQKDFDDENNYWPIRQLKVLARFPHLYNTWLGDGHTISNGNPPEVMADRNQFTGIILLFGGVSMPEDFFTIKLEDKTIRILSMIPLYQEEMDYKLKHGTNGLLEKFDKFGITEVIDINRANTCKKKFWLF